MTIHRPIKKSLNAVGLARPAVASQPGYASQAYIPRATSVNPSSIVNAFSLPPIQEAIIPLSMAAFPGYASIEVQPPEGVTWTDQKKTEAKKGIRKADKTIDSLKQIRWAFADTAGFRHYIGNYDLVTEGNWTLPKSFQRLPAESFGKAPTFATDVDRFWQDPLLRGLIQDRRDGTKHYYQSQSLFGEPVEIPEEELFHIFWELPGNQSIIASLLPTLDFWQYARKCLGLSAARQGVPTAVATFDLAAAQWFAEHSDETLTNGIPASIFNLMDEVVKSQSTGSAYNLPPGGNLVYPPNSGLQPAQDLDQYIERKLVLHLCPTHILDTIGSALSKSSQPAFDLFVLLVDGWREIVAKPFEDFYANLLVEHNGFDEGTQVWFEWLPIIQEDKVASNSIAMSHVVQGITTINEAREKAGYTKLDDAGIAALIDEHNRLNGSAGML